MSTRYWVGGSGNWDATTTTNWAASSGGAGGASAPTSADDVVFDANSNTGTSAFTVTVTGTSASPANCANFSTSALDGAMTLSLGATAQLSCYASMTLPATNFTWSGTAGCSVYFVSTSTGNTLTTNGVTLTNTISVFAGVGGAWTLGSALTVNSGVYVNAGTFNTNNFNITTSGLVRNINTGATTINLGSSTITVSSVTPVSLITTNLTFNAGTSTITCSNASPTITGGVTFYNVSFTSTALGSVTITGANTFNNLTFAARAASGFGVVLFSTGVTNTVNGTLTLGSGTTGVARLQIRSATFSTQTTLSVATLAAITDIDFRDVVATGTSAPWSGTRIGDCGNNTNITGATPRTVYWNSAASANWNGAVWSTTSGNTGGTTTAFPLAQDTVIIDNAGLTTGNTITVNANWQMPTLDFSTRSNAATFATGAQTLSLFGDYILSSAITLTGTGLLTFLKYGGTQTITSAGIAFPQPVQCYVTSGTLRINGNLTLGSTLTFTHAFGTLDLTNNGAGNYTLTTGIFSSSNTNTRAIAFGTGNITITGSGTTILVLSTATNFTYTGTSNITCNYSGSTGSRTIGAPRSSIGGTEANALNINITAGADNVNYVSSDQVIKNYNFTGFSGSTGLNEIIYGNLTLSSGMTIGGASGPVFSGTSGTQQITTNGQTIDFPITQNGVGGTVQLQDALTLGSTRTYTLTNGTLDLNSKTLTTGLFSSNNSNTRSIAFGTGNITTIGSGTVWTTASTTGFSYTGTPTVNISNNSATATTVSTGALTEAQALNFNYTIGSYTLTDTAAVYKTLNFTGFTGTIPNSVRTIYGSAIFVAGMTLTAGANATTFSATSGTNNITTAAKTLDFPITQNGVGGTVQLQDNLTLGSTRTYTLTNGTLDINNKNISTGLFNSNNSNTRSILMGSGTWTLTGTGTVWNLATSTGMTLTSGTSTIVFNGSGIGTFSGGGLTYNNLVQSSTNALTIAGSNTFNSISNTIQPSTLTFTAGTTQNIHIFNINGTAGNLVTLNSTVAGSQFFLVNF